MKKIPYDVQRSLQSQEQFSWIVIFLWLYIHIYKSVYLHGCVTDACHLG